MVKTEKIIEKFKIIVPEFLWKKDIVGTIFGYYFTNRFSFYPDGTMECTMPPEILDTYLKDDIKYCPEESKEKYENNEWHAGSVFDSEEDLNFFLRNLHRYVNTCEAIRHSDEDVDQIVFLHPDIPEDEVLGFLDDFKYIIKPTFCNYGIGVISTKNWDFRNEDLIDLFCSSNGDAFGIEEYEDDVEDEVELLKKLYKKYPSAKGIKLMYTTSYD